MGEVQRVHVRASDGAEEEDEDRAVERSPEEGSPEEERGDAATRTSAAGTGAPLTQTILPPPHWMHPSASPQRTSNHTHVVPRSQVPIDLAAEVAERLVRLSKYSACETVEDTRIDKREHTLRLLTDRVVHYLRGQTFHYSGDAAADRQAVRAKAEEGVRNDQSGKMLEEQERAKVASEAAQRFLRECGEGQIAAAQEEQVRKLGVAAVQTAIEQLLDGSSESDATRQRASYELVQRGEERLHADAMAALPTIYSMPPDEKGMAAYRNTLANDVVRTLKENATELVQKEEKVALLQELNARAINSGSWQSGLNASIAEDEQRKKEEEEAIRERLVEEQKAQKAQKEATAAAKKQKPEAEPPQPLTVWKPKAPVTAPARPTLQPIEYGGLTFDSYASREPVQSEVQFLETITRAEQTRGAIQVVKRGEQLVLNVNSRQKATGVEKVQSYVKESVTPLAQAIERLRRYGRRLISGTVKKDGKNVRFEMGHKPDGTPYLCIGGEETCGDEVAARLAEMVPHTKPDLVLLFKELDPLTPDDLDPTPPSVPKVTSLHPSKLRQDEYGTALLLDCYNEQRTPLYNFAHLKFKIEPPPEKAEAAVVAAKEALEAAKQNVAKERADDERRLDEERAIRAKAEATLGQVPSIDTKQRRKECSKELTAEQQKELEEEEEALKETRITVKGHSPEEALLKKITLAENAKHAADSAIERFENKLAAPPKELTRAEEKLKRAEAALYENHACKIVSVAATTVRKDAHQVEIASGYKGSAGRTTTQCIPASLTHVWLCRVEGEAEPAFATNEFLEANFSADWLRGCEQQEYVGRFRLVAERSWEAKPTAVSAAPPAVITAPPCMPALDARLKANDNVQFWSTAASVDMERGTAPSPSDAYAIGFSTTNRAWWVLLASLGAERPHIVTQGWVETHFRPLLTEGCNPPDAFFSPNKPNGELIANSELKLDDGQVIDDGWRSGHAASPAASEAVADLRAAEAARTAALAEAERREVQKVAAPHLPLEEPIKGLLESCTLRYRGAGSEWFAQLQSGMVVPLHKSVVDACIEPEFQSKCREAFVSVTEASFTAFGSQNLDVASEAPTAPTAAQEALPAGVDWPLYQNAGDLLGIGCATDGFLGFDNKKKKQPKQWRVYYRKDEQIVFDIELRGVVIEGVHVEQYEKISKMISKVKDKAKTPSDKQLPYPLHKPPETSEDNGTSDQVPVPKHAAGGAGGGDGDADEPPPPKRLKRAAAEKADKSFGAYDEGGEDDESGSYRFDESESDQSDEPEKRAGGRKRKGGGGMAISNKQARSSDAGDAAAVAVTGVPVSPPLDKMKRIRTMLGIDTQGAPKVLKEAKERMGLTLTSALGEQKDTILHQLDTLKVKVQSIVDKLEMRNQVPDAALNIPAVLAQAREECKEADIMVPAQGTLLEQADAILAQLS